jgi:uncharacterized repeat protein (TIGR01451 family)
MLASGDVAQAQQPALAHVPGSPFSINGPAAAGPAGPPPVFGSGPESIAFSPDGGLVATANYNTSSVSLFGVAGGTLNPLAGSPFSTHGPDGSGSFPAGVAFSPNGRLLATANLLSNDVSLFDVAGGTLHQVSGSPFSTNGSAAGGDRPESVAFSPDGTLLATANVRSNDVSLFDVAGGTLHQVSGSPFSTNGSAAGGSGPFSVAFSPDGGLLATANVSSNDVSLFDVAGRTLHQVPGSPFPTNGPDGGASTPASVAFSPDGGLLATADYGSSTVSLFNVAGGTLHQVPGSPFSIYGPAGSGSNPRSVKFRPDRGLLATANTSTSNVSVDYVAGGTLPSVAGSPFSTYGPAGSGSSPFAVAFSPGGGLLATANYGSDNVSVFAPTGPLQLTKMASPGEVRPGGTVSYSLEVHNPGADTVVGAVSDDLSGVLDDATYLNDAKSSAGSTALNPSSGTLTWEGVLAAHATATITYSVRVHDGLHGGLLYNGATGPPGSSCTGPDPDLPCITETTIVPPDMPGPDLGLTKRASTPTVRPGGQVTFTLAVHNRGPGGARGVTLEDPGPSGLFFQTAASSLGSCTITRELRCALGALPAGGSAVVLATATVRTDASGSIENIATVWGNRGDPNESNNTARSTVLVAPLPPPSPSPPPPEATVAAGVQPVSDLRLQHHGPSGHVLAGQHHRFTIVLTNHGPDPARDVVITFTSSLPLQIISTHAAHASAVHDSCTSTMPVRCEVGAVPVGGRVTVRIVAVPRVSGVLRTAAAVMSASWDPNPETSLVTAETSVGGPPVHRPSRPPAVTG